MATIDVTMPQMGESVVEGTVTKWLVKEGDQVALDQPLLEISTDKVDTELPSPAAGAITKLIAEEGETLPVGALLAVIEPAAAAEAPTRAAPAPEAAEVARPAPAPPPAAPAAAPSRPAQPSAPAGAPRRYSPVVLKIAAEHGIDLSLVPASGAGGRVSKRDVLNYLDSLGPGAPAVQPPHAGPAAAAPVAAITPGARPTPAPAGAVFHPPVYQPREGDIVDPFSRRRKFIAEHMVYSKTHAPHVGTVAEVDVTNVMRLRQANKEAFAAREGFALTLLPFAAAATIRGLKEFPRMNASVVSDSLVIRKQVNLGIAVDTDEGLVVPVIKAAEGMSVVGLAREIERLHRKVAEKKVTPDDLTGGSFSLSNPGREGNLFGLAIINQPAVGILRMGEVKKRPVVMEVDGSDAIAIRTIMYLALSYDHRVIDGVLANRFLYRVARILETADFEL